MIRQHDLAQPFTLSNLDAEAEEPSFFRSARDCTLIGLGGILAGQLIGWALDASGILASIGFS